MRVAIIQFLGTNCDYDCKFACDRIGVESKFVWHQEANLRGFDCVILPGGFSYEDYLRSGALAKFSSIMSAVKDFAQYGGYVIGICNGFQILTESRLLPGVLLKNNNLKFIHKDVFLKVEKSVCCFTKNIRKNTLKMPIAHGEGNYFCTQDQLKYMQDNSMVVLRYADQDGVVNVQDNPNGSIDNIAGICNKNGNVFGLMPHPERAVGELGKDGEAIWLSLLS